MQEVVLRQAGGGRSEHEKHVAASPGRLREEGREVWGLRRPRSQTLGYLAELMRFVGAG